MARLMACKGMIRGLTLLFFLSAIVCSCSRLMPGGFWDKFETDLRVEKESDHGPWGGTRAYHWTNDKAGYFSKQRIIDFASQNGWILIDSVKYKAAELETSGISKRTVITVRVGPFEPSPGFEEYELPRWTKYDLTLYRFKTAWLIIDPETDNSTQVNGFMTIREDGREMTVYHLWGE